MLSSDTSVLEDLAGIVSRDFRVFPEATSGGTKRLDHQSDTGEDNLTDYLRRNSTMYVAGQLTEKLLLGSSCAGCSKALRSNEITGDHAFLLLEEYDPNAPASTFIPSNNMAAAVIAVQDIFHRDIVPSLNLPKPSKRLREASLLKLDFSWLCSEHADMILDNFFKNLCSLLLHSECKYRNQGAMWRYLNKASANQMQKFLGR